MGTVVAIGATLALIQGPLYEKYAEDQWQKEKARLAAAQSEP